MFFQTILHHLSMVLMGHLAVLFAKEVMFSVEFGATISRCNVSLSLWEGKELVTMVVAQYGRSCC